MENCRPADRDHLRRHQMLAWEAIGNARVDDTQRLNYWRHWVNHCIMSNAPTYLVGLSKPQKHEVLLCFASRVREGVLGNGKEVRVGSVDVALRAVGQTLVMAGYEDPRRSYNQKALDLPISSLLKTYRDADPKPLPELAVPVEVVTHIAGQRQSKRLAAISDLVELQFLFLLRVGEYTFPTNDRRTRTTQFRRHDVIFYKNGHRIDHMAGLEVLMEADGVTLLLDNQKNGVRGAILHHHNSHSSLNPVSVLARIVTRLLDISADPTLPLCSYKAKYQRQWITKLVTAPMILTAVKKAVISTGLYRQGFSSKRVGTHSLWAGGAMAMLLNGVSETSIRKLGRWSGATFEVYIHTQIAALSNNVSSQMVRPIPNFYHVGA